MKEFKKRTYVAPSIEVTKLGTNVQIMAGSVHPGGGGISIIPPYAADDDTDIFG